MTQFPFCYPIGWPYSATFAQVEGRATVDASGEIEVELADMAGEFHHIHGADLESARLWLRAERAAQVSEATDAAWRGAVTYARETARNLNAAE